MIRLSNRDTGADIGKISEQELQIPVAALEEDSQDQNYRLHGLNRPARSGRGGDAAVRREQPPRPWRST